MGTVATVVAILQTVIQELPGAITTAQALYSLGQKFFQTIAGRAPTADEVKQLEDQIDADVITALEPLPPAQPGDPDYKA